MPGASGLGEVGGRAREPDLGRATSAGGGNDGDLRYTLKLSAIAEAENAKKAECERSGRRLSGRAKPGRERPRQGAPWSAQRADRRRVRPRATDNYILKK